MRKVLITGSSRGIGKAVVNSFKSKGDYVIGVSTTRDDRSLCDEQIICDLSNFDQLEKTCNQISEMEIDILINNAGINIIDNFCSIRMDDFLKVQHTNLVAPFRLCQSALPHMANQKWGRIINISSVWGIKSKQGRASYSASKFGLDGLTLAMSHEFGSYNILCNSVAPGFIDTDMTRRNLGQEGIAKMLLSIPVGRLATVDEVANFITWLGSDQNTYITGQNIAIDGGFSRV